MARTIANYSSWDLGVFRRFQDWLMFGLSGFGGRTCFEKKHTHVSQRRSENCMILYDSVMCCSRKSTGNILEY